MKRDTGTTAFTVANLNVENFFDTVDNPHKRDDIPTPAEHQAKLISLAKLIANDMNSPSLIGMEEVENEDVLKELVAMPQLKAAGYSFELIQGPDLRGINTALLYRKNQGVSIANPRLEQGISQLKSLKSPPGAAAKNLFARPPLVADVTVAGINGSAPANFSVMVNHFMSKYSPTGTPTEPARVEQAQFVRALATRLQKQDPTRGVMMRG